MKEHVSICFFILSLYISSFSASYCIASGVSYLLLLKFSNPKMSSSPMDWRLSLGFWEVGLKMAELILFTIHKKIRPYIPWEKKMKEELEHIIRDFGCNLLLATVLLSYAWELQGPGALSVNHIRLLSQEETQLWKHPQSLNKEAVSSNTFTKASLPSAAWTTFRGLDTLSPRTMMERFVRLFWSSLESTWRNSHSNLVIPGG